VLITDVLPQLALWAAKLDTLSDGEFKRVDEVCGLLAERASMMADEIECIEEGGTEPTVALLRVLAAALDADVRLSAGHDMGSVGFETLAA
jgi:hypothetical protein